MRKKKKEENKRGMETETVGSKMLAFRKLIWNEISPVDYNLQNEN